jgi:hypothetical protein
MCAEYRSDPCRFGELLEFDCSVDGIGVGAGQCRKPILGSGLDEVLRAAGAGAEGEPGVDVQVREHPPDIPE